MPTTLFTERGIRIPGEGTLNWADENNDSLEIISGVLSQILNKNFVADGLVASDGGTLQVDTTAGHVVVGHDGFGQDVICFHDAEHVLAAQSDDSLSRQRYFIYATDSGELGSTPSSYTVLNGTIEAGSDTIGDIAAANDTYLQVNEVSGDGCTIEIDLTIPAGSIATDLHFEGRYDGSPAHYCNVFAYNWETTNYDQIDDGSVGDRLDDSPGTDYTRNWELNPQHSGHDGVIRIRIIHNVTGYGNSDDLYIDYLQANYIGELTAATSLPTGEFALIAVADVDESDLIEVYDLRNLNKYGADLVTDGDMSSNANYTEGTGWSIGSGVATFTHGSGDGTLSQDGILKSKAWFLMIYDVTANTFDGDLQLPTTMVADSISVDAALDVTVGTDHAKVFYTDGSDPTDLDIEAANGSTGAISIDNLRCYRLT